jgi:hypothetical protein
MAPIRGPPGDGNMTMGRPLDRQIAPPHPPVGVMPDHDNQNQDPAWQARNPPTRTDFKAAPISAPGDRRRYRGRFERDEPR